MLGIRPLFHWSSFRSRGDALRELSRMDIGGQNLGFGVLNDLIRVVRAFEEEAVEVVLLDVHPDSLAVLFRMKLDVKTLDPNWRSISVDLQVSKEQCILIQLLDRRRRILAGGPRCDQQTRRESDELQIGALFCIAVSGHFFTRNLDRKVLALGLPFASRFSMFGRLPEVYFDSLNVQAFCLLVDR